MQITYKKLDSSDLHHNVFWMLQLLQQKVVRFLKVTHRKPKLSHTCTDSITTTVLCKKKKLSFATKYWIKISLYLRSTQELKITGYGRNKYLLEIYTVYNGVCVKLPQL